MGNELWSNAVAFDGSDTSSTITLLPADKIFYSSALADGDPRSLELTATDTVDSAKVAELFFDDSKTAVEGTVLWNYEDPKYDDFSKSDIYELKETITTSEETVVLTRSVKILPEPACLALFAILGGLLIARKKGAFVLLVFTVASLGAFADVTVTSVNAQQAWPFKRSVVINYTLASDTQSVMPVFTVDFYGTFDNGETVFKLSDRGTLEKDGANGVLFEAGTHKVIWNPAANLTLKSNNLKIKVSTTDVTSTADYLVFDLTTSSVRASSVGPNLSSDDCRTKELWMRRIEPGTFNMGSPSGELGRESDETQHSVAITEPYYIAVFETTQKQYKDITGADHNRFHVGDTLPDEYICYRELRGDQLGAQWPSGSDVDATYQGKPTFFYALREKFNNNFLFDLPTEAMWEYACRAGSTTALNNNTDLSSAAEDPNMNAVGWYLYNAANQTYAPGQKVPNAWGLYDMHGNVWEWCLDWYAGFDGADEADPKGPLSGDTRVIKSGSWYQYAQSCRSAERRGNLDWHAGDDYIGFRVALHPSPKKYMVVDLSGGTSASSYPVSYLTSVPEGGWGAEYKTTKLVLRLVEPGTFTMGSPVGETGRDHNHPDRETQHTVTLTKPYYIGVFETTQKQYELIKGTNPADLNIGSEYPVEQVSYDMIRGNDQGKNWPADNNVDSDSFMGVLRAKTGLTFDLPTEAQWEYACRAETGTALNSGKDLTSRTVCPNMAEVGRYTHNTNDGKGNNYTKPGLYMANNWGIFDTHGNLYELCLDWVADFSSDAQVDPKGPSSGSGRAIRGGGWKCQAEECRAASRVPVDGSTHAQDIGFRVVVEQ
ncbi:SUMF1/EgtB/PvdO family nonheme iron enzyme [bacterium]|nr:SUMF1/EgtB/PvdO family nonheme iron enzyme [bacterium]